MSEIPVNTSGLNDLGNEDWPGIDSRFRLVILAGLRSKQLLLGSTPRVVANPLRKKNTSIALEELRRGLITWEQSEITPKV